eukprot:1794957-Rhodomonas_salina.1
MAVSSTSLSSDSGAYVPDAGAASGPSSRGSRRVPSSPSPEGSPSQRGYRRGRPSPGLAEYHS